MAAAWRAFNLLQFSAVCFAVAFVWDVAYAGLWDIARLDGFSTLPSWLPLFLLFGAPMLLCVGAGYRLDQWRADRSGLAQAGAAAWCVVTPFVVLIPFFAFMCFAFGSCIGD